MISQQNLDNGGHDPRGRMAGLLVDNCYIRQTYLQAAKNIKNTVDCARGGTIDCAESRAFIAKPVGKLATASP